MILADAWTVPLDDDTTTFYHRIVEVRSRSGELLWSRCGEYVAGRKA